MSSRAKYIGIQFVWRLIFNFFLLKTQFHDDEDVSQHCALSHVSRWCFSFADNICSELGISLLAGYHLPANADVAPRAPVADTQNGEASGERGKYTARGGDKNYVSTVPLIQINLKKKVCD